jgi:N-acetylglutamate synthase-like GNAT family acetyltransferase
MSTPSTKIRVATLADAEKLLTLINDAFRVAENFFVKRDRLDRDELNQLISKGTFLVAEEDSVMLGCVYVEPTPAINQRGYLGLLSVYPNKQRGGTGSRLMDAAEEYCRGLGCHFMDIRVVNLREELPGFYERRGYVKTGIGEFPPEVETLVPCHFVEMTKELR